jgi:hypothetical protein
VNNRRSRYGAPQARRLAIFKWHRIELDELNHGNLHGSELRNRLPFARRHSAPATLGRRRGEGVGITALGEKTPNRARARLSPAGNVAHPDIAITAIYQKAVVLPPSHELV